MNLKKHDSRCFFKYSVTTILIINMLFLNITPVKAETPNKMNSSKMNINARSAIAMDAKTKRILYEKNAEEPVAMASTTKIMTSLVALNYGDLKSKVTISKNAASVRGSHAGYRVGEEISMEELLYGLMLRSGNDAAIAIAEGMSGSIDKFCDLMNEYAYAIGALDSHFESPHGLDSTNHYSTPYDLALITAKAKEINKFNEIVSCKEIHAEEKGFSRSYNNINKILWQIPEANGVKTGYTGNAGKCLVTSVNLNGNDVIIVVLNSPTRWKETKKIYDFVKENYEFKKVVKDKEVMGTIDLNKRNTVNLICRKEIVLPLRKNTQYLKKVVVKKDLTGIDIEKGEEIGKLIIEDEHGEILCQQPLISDKKINGSKNKFKRLSKIKNTK